MSEDKDIDSSMIMLQAGLNEIAELAFDREPEFDRFLTDNLRMWKASSIPAPLNEIQSIHAWMGMIYEKGPEETLKTMAARLVLLNRAAQELHAQGPAAEKAAGIYEIS